MKLSLTFLGSIAIMVNILRLQEVLTNEVWHYDRTEVVDVLTQH